MKVGLVSLATWSLLANTVAGSKNHDMGGMLKNIRGYLGNPRGLQTTSETQAAITTRCWTECVEQALTADECMALIQTELGMNLELHEIPHLQIMVHTPRDEFWFGLTYFQVGISTDLFGNVACDKSLIRYEYLWEVELADGSGTELVEIPDYDCLGKTSVQCCTDYMDFLKNQDIPLVDAQGNCLSCWVHQEPLEPILASDNSGDVLYIDHQFDPNAQECKAISLPEDMVIDVDNATSLSLADDILEMETIMEAEFATCAQLHQLQERLLTHARGVNTAMNFVATLLCGLCEGGRGGSYGPLPDSLTTKFTFIIRQIRKTIIQSNVNYIIIYTDKDGNVIEPPKVGGSRAGIDWNLDDPDCKEDDDSTPPDVGYDENLTDDTTTPPPPPPPVTTDDEIPPSSFDDRSGPLQPQPTCNANEVPSDPVLGAQFSSYDVTFACHEPTGTDMDSPNGYSLELTNYDNTILKDDSKRTRFTYKVCSKLDDLVNKVVIPWKGHCTVTKYHYLNIEFDGCGYEAGKDPTTCVVGFMFDESWHSVAAFADPATNQVCAEFLLEVDGWVSKTNNVGSVATESDKYVLIGVQGPDCRAC